MEKLLKHKFLSLFISTFIIALAVSFVPSTKAKADELMQISVSGKYDQSSARSIYNMIIDFRTGSEAWYYDENNHKVYANCGKLSYDAKLEKVAMKRAMEIAVNYSHTRPNGDSCFGAYFDYGVYYMSAGENIARHCRNADEVHYGFREDAKLYNGQGHRRNMLNSNYNAVGLAHVVCNGVDYWVEEFAYLDDITDYGSPDNSYVTVPVTINIDCLEISDNYTGLYNVGNIWIYVKNGGFDKSYTGLALYNDSWWYVKNGMLDFSYTGLCKYGNAWYYVANGRLNGNAKGLCKYNGNWFYVDKGKVNFGYTGYAKNAGNWFYVQNGVVNWKYTGLARYNGSWFYAKNGVIDWKYTGLCRYGNAWYYVANGKLNWYAKGLCKYNGNWFYVNGGKVDFGYTGLARNAGNWFYIHNGVLNWNYTGKCPYNGKYFNVKNGVVVF